MLNSLIVVSILQCIHVLKHHVVHLKYIPFYLSKKQQTTNKQKTSLAVDC